MTSLLILLLLAIALVLWLRRPRAQRTPAPPSPSPYARDDAFGRPDPAWGAGMPPPQEGMGSSIARGVATGLAIGAGAAIAQEFGRRASEHGQQGQQGQGHAPDPAVPHADQSHSQLAHDAGIDAFDPAADPQGFGDFGWDDGGGFDDGGGDWNS